MNQDEMPQQSAGVLKQLVTDSQPHAASCGSEM